MLKEDNEQKAIKSYSMVRYIHRRIQNNKNFLVTITGPTGSGKSWSALSIARLLDPEFPVSNIVFKGRELMKLINHGDLKPGSVILWDEAGIDLSNRNWQSVTNKMLNALLQTFRHQNFILIFTVPFHDFIDSSSRKLFHADFETQYIDKVNKEVVIKPKLLQYNSNMGKWYRKYLKVQVDYHRIKIKRWSVPKPSDELIKEYEIARKKFTKDLNMDIDRQLEKLEGPKDNMQDIPLALQGKPITCPRCNHVWGYKGTGMMVQCPQCLKKIKNPYVEIPIVVMGETCAS